MWLKTSYDEYVISYGLDFKNRNNIGMMGEVEWGLYIRKY